MKIGTCCATMLRPWLLRSSHGGRAWTKHDTFPAGDAGWSEHIPFGDIWRGSEGALHTSCYQGQFNESATSAETKSWRYWHLRSDDEGATCQSPRRVTSIGDGKDHGEVNGHLKRLKDGRLLLSYTVRTKGKKGVCAKLSNDDGLTWTEPVRIVNYIGRAKGGGDGGYPSSAQLANGAVIPGKDTAILDFHAKIDLLVTAMATGSSNAIVCGSAMIPRELSEPVNLPSAAPRSCSARAGRPTKQR